MAGKDIRLQVRVSGMSRINKSRKMNLTKQETTKKDFVSNANEVNKKLRRHTGSKIIDESNKGNRQPCQGRNLYPCGYEYGPNGQEVVCYQYQIPIEGTTGHQPQNMMDRAKRALDGEMAGALVRPVPGGGIPDIGNSDSSTLSHCPIGMIQGPNGYGCFWPDESPPGRSR